MSLAKALGYEENDRLLIVNGDDYGLCHSVNQAVQQLLKEEVISSATLMLPCGWSRDAALWSARNPQYDVGVHFTFTSEWDAYSWGPVSYSGDVTSLVTKEGYFYKDSRSFEENADAAQVTLELISQVERALQLGMLPTHADNHMGSLYGRETNRHFMPEVLDVCATYGLPFRLPRYVNRQLGAVAPPEMEEQAKRIAALADAKGVVILDYLVSLPFQLLEGETLDSFKGDISELLKSLKPGVTELIIHPSLVTDELKAFHQEPMKRGLEFEVFRDEEIQRVMKEEGIKLIRWRELQKLQRDRRC